MGFDAGRFQSAGLKPRMARVPVSALAPFFSDGEPAEFEVRGLTASELQVAIEADRRINAVESVVAALASKADQVAAIRAALGLSSKETPGEIRKRIEMLVSGCVSPVIDHATAVRIAEHYAIEFLILTNKITELTGMGADMGKVEHSSPMPESSAASTLPSSEEDSSLKSGRTSSRKAA